MSSTSGRFPDRGVNSIRALSIFPCRLEMPQLFCRAQADAFNAVGDSERQLDALLHSAADLDTDIIESKGLLPDPPSLLCKRNRNATPTQTSMTQRRKVNVISSQCYKSHNKGTLLSKGAIASLPKSHEFSTIDGPNGDDTFFLKAPGNHVDPLGTKYFLRPRPQTFTDHEVEGPTPLWTNESSFLECYSNGGDGRTQTTAFPSSPYSQSLNNNNTATLHDGRQCVPTVSPTKGLKMKPLRPRWSIFDNYDYLNEEPPSPPPGTTCTNSDDAPTINPDNDHAAKNADNNHDCEFEPRTPEGQVIRSTELYPEKMSLLSSRSSQSSIIQHDGHENVLPYFPMEGVVVPEE